jgi:amino acid transporter
MAATEEREQVAVLDAEGMKRDVGLLGLLWASEGSIIGSGWLFGALTAAAIAGPSCIISWIIASVIVVILALVHAELGGLFPVTGGTSRFPHYAFGSFAGATFGWFSFLQAAAVAPIEVLAALQYLSTTSWAHGVWNSHKGTLSGTGIFVGFCLMLVFVIINLIGIRWLARANNGITWWKVLIPVFTIIVFLLFKFHPENFSANGGFFIHGAAFKQILIAIPSGGIVFALLGFEQAVQLGGESSNPKRDLPRAVIGSILIGAVIYLLVQVAFIGALDPKLLTEAGTWSGLNNPHTTNAELLKLQAAPFYTVALLASFGWLAWILRLDAVVSPTGTALIYTTSTSRISFGLSKNGYIPSIFEWNTSNGVPIFGILFATALGMLMLLPFPSWASLVNLVTSASVMMYAGAPLAAGALRLSKPDLPRPYRLPAGGILAPLAFICANLIVFWAGWATYSTLMFLLILGFLLIGLSYGLNLNPHRPVIDWTAAIWVLPYLIGMGVISYFGIFGTGHPFAGHYGFEHILKGGNGDLTLYWSLLVVAVFSLIIYYAAIYFRLSTQKVDEYVRDVYPPPLAAE